MMHPDPDDPRLGHYDMGRTPFFALQVDRRFSYCLAVPPDYNEAGRHYSLLVLIHGTGRSRRSTGMPSPNSPRPMTASCWRRSSRRA